MKQKRRKAKEQGPKLLLVVSDLHCGSSVGVAPYEYQDTHGNTIGVKGNKVQEWLLACWEELMDSAMAYIGSRPFIFLINGDATEGCHHGNAVQIVSATIEDHTNAAVELVKEIAADAHSTIVIKGTECHTRNMEDELARKIGGVGDRAHEHYLFEIHGTLVNATHHIAATSRCHLEGNGLSMAMHNALRAEARAGHRQSRVFLRGHRHTGGCVTDFDSAMVVTGGFQFLTRHGKKVVPDSIPRPSICVLDWTDSELDSVPAIKPFQRHAPQAQIQHF